MNHLKLTISGINRDNIEQVYDFIAQAGYAGEVFAVNDTVRTIDIRDAGFRQRAGISDSEIHMMISNLIIYTSCTVKSELVENSNKRKAYTLCKGDKFKLDGYEAVYVLQYDAYYPDRADYEVALIFNEEGKYVSQSRRVHGQLLIEVE